MHVYRSSPEYDMALVRWWMDLYNGGEMNTIFGKVMSLVDFVSTFLPPRTLLFECDDIGIWIAAWFEPIMSGAYMGFWIAKRKRRTRDAYKAAIQIYDLALAEWPVIIGVTRQEKLLDIHENMGYTSLGKIPHLWDGQDAYVLCLTKESLRGRRRR